MIESHYDKKDQSDFIVNAIKKSLKGRKELTEDQLVYNVIEILYSGEEEYQFDEEEIVNNIKRLAVEGILIEYTVQNRLYFQLKGEKKESVSYKPKSLYPEIEMTWYCQFTSSEDDERLILSLNKELKADLKKYGFSIDKIPHDNIDSLSIKIGATFMDEIPVQLVIDDDMNVFITSWCKISEIPMYDKQPASINELRKLNSLNCNNRLLVLTPGMSANYGIYTTLLKCLQRYGGIGLKIVFMKYDPVE